MKKLLLILLIVIIAFINGKGGLINTTLGFNENQTINQNLPIQSLNSECIVNQEPQNIGQVAAVSNNIAELDMIANYLKNTHHIDFLPVAKDILNSCLKYNIPWDIVLAIAILESGYGQSNIAKDKQNFFALGAYDWDPYNCASDFSNLTLPEAIDLQVLILKNDYFIPCKNNIDEISKKYCKNSKHWLNEVKIISQDIKNQKGGVK